MIAHKTSWCMVVGFTLTMALPIAPSIDAKERQVRLQVQERWATKGPTESPFVAIEGMAEAKDGSIWVSDARASRIYAITRDGASARVVAFPGDGPGEVRMPHLIAAMPDGGLAVYDVGHRAIEVYKADKSFLRRHPLDHLVSNPKGFVVLPTMKFVLSGGIWGTSESIHLFGIDGQREHSWMPAPKTTNVQASVLLAGGPLAMARNGDLLFSRAAPHEILAFSTNGKRRLTIASDKRLLQPVGDDFIQERGMGAAMVRSFRWYFPQSKAVFQLPNGLVLNIIRLFDERKSVWELYASNGSLVTRAIVDRAYSPWGLTRSGDVLASYVDSETLEHVAVRLAFKY